MLRFDGDYLTALRLALDTTLPPTDPRGHLTGVCFDFPQGRMVASDGTRAFIAALPPADPEDLPGEALTLRVVNPATGAPVRKLPPGWLTVNLDLEALALRGWTRGMVQGEFRLEVVPGTFPAIDRVAAPFLEAVATESAPAGKPAALTLNPALLSGWIVGREPSLGLTLAYNDGVPYGALVTLPLSIAHLGLVMGMNFPAPDPRQIVGNLVTPFTAPEVAKP